jgi:crossover junction endodeoxyribonuclease RusA
MQSFTYDMGGPVTIERGDGYVSIDVSGVEVIPAVRMTQRSKHADPRAKRYLACRKAIEDRCAYACNQSGVVVFPVKSRLTIEGYVYGPNLKGDWDNYAKTITDALQGILYGNDRDIVSGRFEKVKREYDGFRILVQFYDPSGLAPSGPDGFPPGRV